MTQTPEFQTALTNFAAAVQSMLDARYGADYILGPTTITIEPGRRYTRLYRVRKGHRQIYCFIDQNGDILKAASYKAPAKHARGSIFSDDAIKAVNTYGANYLR